MKTLVASRRQFRPPGQYLFVYVHTGETEDRGHTQKQHSPLLEISTFRSKIRCSVFRRCGDDLAVPSDGE